MARFKFNFAQISGGIIVPVLVLVIGIGGYFVLLPKYRGIATTKEALAAKQSEVQSRESQLSGIKSLVEDLKNKQNSLAAIDETVPTAPRIPELLANFDALAKQSGLFLSNVQIIPAPTLTSLTAGQNVQQVQRLESLLGATKKLGVMQIKVTLRGGYGNLKTFLLALEQNLRLMDVQGLVVTSGSDKSGVKEYSIVLYTYYQKE